MTRPFAGLKADTAQPPGPLGKARELSSPASLAPQVLEAIEPGPINSPGRGRGGRPGRARGDRLWIGCCGGVGRRRRSPEFEASSVPDQDCSPLRVSGFPWAVGGQADGADRGDPSSLLGGFQRQKCQDISCEGPPTVGPSVGQSCHRDHVPSP